MFSACEYYVMRNLKRAAKLPAMVHMMGNGARPWWVSGQRMIILSQS
uniref:Uncharacterized protein n=1 Tax=Anguilla anguilla TaxID=7936 RepID=A0A0E9QW17_ANGAN